MAETIDWPPPRPPRRRGWMFVVAVLGIPPAGHRHGPLLLRRRVVVRSRSATATCSGRRSGCSRRSSAASPSSPFSFFTDRSSRSNRIASTTSPAAGFSSRAAAQRPDRAGRPRGGADRRARHRRRDRREHGQRVDDALASTGMAAGSPAPRPSIRSSTNRSRSTCSRCRRGGLLTGWLMTLAVVACGVAIFFVTITSGTRIGRPGRTMKNDALWRGLSIAFACFPARAGVEGVSGPLRSAPHRPHDFRRRHLHGGPHHADGSAGGRDRARRRRGAGTGQCRRGAAVTMAHRRRRAGGGLLRRRRCPRLVREQLHRQAERARARAAVHRAQHRDDAAGVRPASSRAAAVPRRSRASTMPN